MSVFNREEGGDIMHYYMTEYGIRFELHLYREALVETSF